MRVWCAEDAAHRAARHTHRLGRQGGRSGASGVSREEELAQHRWSADGNREICLSGLFRLITILSLDRRILSGFHASRLLELAWQVSLGRCILIGQLEVEARR